MCSSQPEKCGKPNQLETCEYNKGTLIKDVSLPRFSMRIFPSLSSWGHAAKLYVAAYTGVVVFTSFFWFCLLTIPLAIIAGAALLSPFLLLFAIGSLIAGFVFYQIIRFIYFLFLKAFWSHPPKVIAPKGFRASLHSYYILTLASLPLTIVCYLPMFIDLYVEMQTTHQISRHRDLTTPVMMWFSWLWFIAAAYLYQWFPLQQQQQKPTVRGV